MLTGITTEMLLPKMHGFGGISLTLWVITFFAMTVSVKLLELVSSISLDSVKRKLFQQKEIEMPKKEVDTQKLTPFVVMPLEIELCFNLWWKDLPDDHEVVIRYPYERHGLAGKVSNHAKTDTKERFLEFVDANSQPNGRRLNSHNPMHSLFYTKIYHNICTPKKCTQF